MSWDDQLTITERGQGGRIGGPRRTAARRAGVGAHRRAADDLGQRQHGHRSADRAAGPRCRRACAGGGRAPRPGQHDPVPDHARAVLRRLGRAGSARAVEARLSAGPGAAAAADEFPALRTGSEPHAHAGVSRRRRVVRQCGRHLPGARRAAGGGGRQGGAGQADPLGHSGYRSGQGEVALHRRQGRKPARRPDVQLVRGGPHGPAVGGQLPVELAALPQPDGGGWLLSIAHRAFDMAPMA